MDITNLALGIGLSLLSLSGFVIAILQNSQKEDAIFPARIRRALLTGVGFAVFSIAGVVSFTYLTGSTYEQTWNDDALFSFICLLLPFVLLTIVGSFIWYSRQNTIQHFWSERLKKIIDENRKTQ
jgi:uncharacterized membrane protein